MESKGSWTVADAVDYNGLPVDKSKTGGWITAAFILGSFSSLLFSSLLLSSGHRLESKGSWTVADAVDYNGLPVDKSKTGGWITAAFILGSFSSLLFSSLLLSSGHRHDSFMDLIMQQSLLKSWNITELIEYLLKNIAGIEVVERLSTMGIAVNLVTYLMETMHLPSSNSANIVTDFMGTSFLLCLLGGFLADSFLGRFKTIAIFSTIQALKSWNITELIEYLLKNIAGIEVVERLSTMGIAVNLVTYLMETMHLPSSNSANIVTDFMGTSFLLCLLGGFLADSFLGRFKTIAIFSTIQALGTGALAVATKLPELRPPTCHHGETCTTATAFQMTFLYIALYLIALGTGGLKSSISGFGSDQFDDKDPKEKAQMAFFFNRFFFIISMGTVGSGEAFIYTGQLDFFITQSPKGMKTMSTGLFLTTLSLGFFVSSFLVSIVKKVTATSVNGGWLADNINHGRLDLFYWLLAILSGINFVVYVICALWFKPTKGKDSEEMEKGKGFSVEDC
ncbi:hypothetical protein F2Q68_00035633 [Brassica cretica]|uniref:Uncharacterized protein n=1 Tax=Brassica cretica TaxID=69181 RepID=A0A8S9HA41_BRACR|nr:hypothetical protein F2Q68_00035633 [Brassica cretica]